MNKKKKAPLEKLEQYREDIKEIKLQIECRKKEIEEDVEWVSNNWMKILFREACKQVKKEEKAKIEESQNKEENEKKWSNFALDRKMNLLYG